MQQIRASLMPILANFCACSVAGCARLRHCTRQQLDAEILQHQNVFVATSAEVLVHCASTAQRICNEFAQFLVKSCAPAAPTARFFGAQHGAELHWSCADVMRIKNRNLCRRNRKLCCAARRNGENFAANSCVIDANFGKLLRMFDRWMRAFSALHAPATQYRNPATSECFRSHAGRSFGALRVDRADNLQ